LPLIDTPLFIDIDVSLIAEFHYIIAIDFLSSHFRAISAAATFIRQFSMR